MVKVKGTYLELWSLPTSLLNCSHDEHLIFFNISHKSTLILTYLMLNSLCSKRHFFSVTKCSTHLNPAPWEKMTHKSFKILHCKIGKWDRLFNHYLLSSCLHYNQLLWAWFVLVVTVIAALATGCFLQRFLYPSAKQLPFQILNIPCPKPKISHS